MTRSPDFLIIGAMKAATSTLHDQLAAVDGIYMSTPKELYFFSDDAVYQRGLDWYLDHFREAPDGALCGESTTHYSKLPTHPRSIERIAQHLPDPRFVYVMRHPIDRLTSHYTHMWLERETTVSFHDAVDGALPELIEYGRYAYQLQPFFAAFGAERVLPVFFDRLFSEKDEELQRVCRFIGLSEQVMWSEQIGAANVSTERLQRSRWREAIHRLPLYDRARAAVPEAWVEQARRRWRPSDLPPLRDDQLERITEIFDTDLDLLGSWLGQPLSVDTFRATTAALANPSWTSAVNEQFPVPR